MFGSVISAFGFTVVLCMAPSLVIALVVPFILMRFARPPKDNPTTPENEAKQPSRGRRIVGRIVTYAQFYFLALIVLVTGSIIFWWALLTFTGTENTVDFAAQSFPVEEAVLEDIVEPDATVLPAPGS